MRISDWSSDVCSSDLGTEPVIWVDVLDLPLVENLAVSQFEFNYQEEDSAGNAVRKEIQTISLPEDYSTMIYGNGGFLPTFISPKRGESAGSPMFVYRWADARAALNRMRHLDGCPFDGIMLEYVNPVNGKALTTTTGFFVQLLRPGEATQSHRQTCSSAYCCLEGRGRTYVGDTVLE